MTSQKQDMTYHQISGFIQKVYYILSIGSSCLYLRQYSRRVPTETLDSAAPWANASPPGFPAWREADGRYCVVAASTAAGLATEGKVRQ